MWPLQIAYKEFRQLLPIVIVGLLLVVNMVFELVGIGLLGMSQYRPSNVPFYNHATNVELPLLGCLIAGLTGFWQTIAESVRDTWLFLLHRPVSRRKIMLAKLASGMLLVWLITGLPMLVYLLWAVTPGNVAAPFMWESTIPFTTNWLALSIVYLGCFLAGLRKARWYGTRLLPVVTTAATALLLIFSDQLSNLSMTGEVVPPVVLLLAILVVDLFLIATILIQCDGEDY